MDPQHGIRLIQVNKLISNSRILRCKDKILLQPIPNYQPSCSLVEYKNCQQLHSKSVSNFIHIQFSPWQFNCKNIFSNNLSQNNYPCQIIPLPQNQVVYALLSQDLQLVLDKLLGLEQTAEVLALTRIVKAYRNNKASMKVIERIAPRFPTASDYLQLLFMFFSSSDHQKYLDALLTLRTLTLPDRLNFAVKMLPIPQLLRFKQLLPMSIPSLASLQHLVYYEQLGVSPPHSFFQTYLDETGDIHSLSTLVHKYPLLQNYFQSIDRQGIKKEGVPKEIWCETCNAKMEEREGVWCQKCGHGGHAPHILRWFQYYHNCPNVDCCCKCN